MPLEPRRTEVTRFAALTMQEVSWVLELPSSGRRKSSLEVEGARLQRPIATSIYEMGGQL